MRVKAYLIILALLLAPAFSEEQNISITDEDGRNVIVPASPKSIVCLSPGAAEAIYSLGRSDLIVAITDDCDMPPALLKKGENRKVQSKCRPGENNRVESRSCDCQDRRPLPRG